MPVIVQSTPAEIARAAALLQQGELVAFPTETVYGLGAHAASDQAVSGIYRAKGRPSHNPLIVHIHSAAQMEQLALPDARALTLAATLWPGPLTLVLPARQGNGLSALATAGLGTVALRMPAHPIAMALLRAADIPVAAPSANASGNISPTTAEHVARSLGDNAPFILAGGASTVGLESTVLDLSVTPAVILRPGAIGMDDLEPLIGEVVFADADTPLKAPGQLKRHYATNTPLRLNAVDVKAGEAFLGFGKTQFIGVEGVGFVKDMPHQLWRNLSAQGDLHEAATHLYTMLHELDQAGATGIAVQAIPSFGLGIALNDRLQRAAVPKEDASS